MKKFLVTLEELGLVNLICFVVAPTEKEAREMFVEENWDCKNPLFRVIGTGMMKRMLFRDVTNLETIEIEISNFPKFSEVTNIMNYRKEG